MHQTPELRCSLWQHHAWELSNVECLHPKASFSSSAFALSKQLLAGNWKRLCFLGWVYLAQGKPQEGAAQLGGQSSRALTCNQEYKGP